MFFALNCGERERERGRKLWDDILLAFKYSSQILYSGGIGSLGREPIPVQRVTVPAEVESVLRCEKRFSRLGPGEIGSRARTEFWGPLDDATGREVDPFPKRCLSEALTRRQIGGRNRERCRKVKVSWRGLQSQRVKFEEEVAPSLHEMKNSLS